VVCPLQLWPARGLRAARSGDALDLFVGATVATGGASRALFRALTPRSAQRALLSNSFRVELDSAEDTHDGWIIYDCKGDDDSILFTLWLPEGSAVEEVMVVRGTLKIIQHAPSQINPDGFTEYRLTARVAEE
jgi:hypothetical protein